MRKVKLNFAAATVIIVCVAAFLFGACSDDATAPTVTTPAAGAQSKNEGIVLAIDGYVYGPYGILVGAEVVWKCDDCNDEELGTCYSNSQGYYDIYADDWNNDHHEHHLYGVARKLPYAPDGADIFYFDMENIPYHIDFHLTGGE